MINILIRVYQKLLMDEYNSNNTKLLNVEEMKKMLLDLQEIQEDLKIN